jgi:Protein of unknown function (DUF1592)/Protein of unknown function (DUF1588)/Protein of unknown function (DUF1587)/Protein of unknown function (DUF1595)/Protein of unknown function (DUF1585)
MSMAKRLFLLVTICGAALLVAGRSQSSRFSKDLYPILEKAGCEGCHNPNGVASATRLHFPQPGASPDAIEAFGASLSVLVDASNPENSLLLMKPTNRIAHTGGRRIAPGGPEEAALRAWVTHLTTLPAAGVARGSEESRARPERTVLRRMTHSQYDNTVRELLGDTSSPARQFPPEDFVDGFKNQYEAQSISPLLAEAYNAAAERLASNAIRAFRSGDAKGLIPCQPSSDPNAECRTRFIRQFGLRAFRRPLTDAELSRYAELSAGPGDFLEGARIVMEAMLQSPSFLFWLDSTTIPEWKPYARASKLSYFLWDSMPDEWLLESARAGELDSPDGFEKAARKMLASPKAVLAVDEFVSQWLRFDEVANMLKERRAFPQFTRELALAMAEETRRLVSDLVWNDRNFMELYSANYTFVNGDLAAVYNLPTPASDFARVSYPAESERAGILGQGTFLALTSKPAETSPTARGLFVREHLLCQRVPLPPPGVNMNLPPLTEDKPRTNRDRLAVHLSNESCAGCHKLIDPIGFGFEKFDALGARHDKFKVTLPGSRRNPENKPASIELEVDTKAFIAGIENSEFSSPKELGQILASNRQCQECVVKQLFRYAVGRAETTADKPILDRAYESFQRSQFRFKELMIAVIKWTEFTPGRI